MATYVMVGKYTAGSFEGMSSERTAKVVEQIKGFGGTVNAMYALLGQNDLLFIVDFPSTTVAMKASVAINKATSISFTTSPAVSVEEFDAMLGDL